MAIARRRRSQSSQDIGCSKPGFALASGPGSRNAARLVHLILLILEGLAKSGPIDSIPNFPPNHELTQALVFFADAICYRKKIMGSRFEHLDVEKAWN